MAAARFDLQAPFAPAGDQPRAIAELTAGLERGDRFQTLLGVTGSGKTMTIANVIQAYRPPDARALAQQDARRAALRGAQELLPAQRGRVLHLVLRLLPAGSVRPHDATRTSRRTPRSTKTSTACGCGRRRASWSATTSSSSRRCRRSTASAIPSHLPRDDGHARARPEDRARRHPARARSDPVLTQRRRVRARHLPRARRHGRDLPGVRRAGRPRRDVGRRDRADLEDQLADRRDDRDARAGGDLPGEALRHVAADARAGGRR